MARVARTAARVRAARLAVEAAEARARRADDEMREVAEAAGSLECGRSSAWRARLSALDGAWLEAAARREVALSDAEAKRGEAARAVAALDEAWGFRRAVDRALARRVVDGAGA